MKQVTQTLRMKKTWRRNWLQMVVSLIMAMSVLYSAVVPAIAMDTGSREQVLTASGADYTVTVICGPEAGIPADATLRVSELQQGSPEYEQYRSQTDHMAEAEGEKVGSARFFDIAIRSGGREIEPKAPVQVRIDYDGPQEIGQNVSAVHFGQDGA